MNDDFDREARRVPKSRGVITRTPSRLPGILSFLLTGALFASALILTLSHALADGHDKDCHHDYVRSSSTCQDAQR